MSRVLHDTWRRIRKSTTVRRAGCWVVAQYMGFVWATGRWEVQHGEIPTAFWDRGEPFVLAFWHGRLLMLPCMWPRRARMNILVSMHPDGEIISNAISYFGLASIRGSAAKPGSTKNKGGVAALRSMLKALQARESVGISPDGPRGPRMRATEGIVTVARMSGQPIIPCSYSVRSRFVLRTWDRFVVPLPFTRGVIVWGEPIYVPRDADANGVNAARLAVEAGLNAATDAADAAMGVDRVEAAPAPDTSSGAVA
ncbi:MAG: lysophospholipid acyltransferase family protein [Alphaproteobacteria bacterium]|nr:lysophospholipid acyltransferase family protein [Alphaproteobacteria bacterium]